MKKMIFTLLSLATFALASCSSEAQSEEALYMDKDLVHLSCCSDMGQVIAEPFED